MSNGLTEKEKLLQQKRESCNFYEDISPEGLSEWCKGKDAYCDGWCTA